MSTMLSPISRGAADAHGFTRSFVMCFMTWTGVLTTSHASADDDLPAEPPAVRPEAPTSILPRLLEEGRQLFETAQTRLEQCVALPASLEDLEGRISTCRVAIEAMKVDRDKIRAIKQRVLSTVQTSQDGAEVVAALDSLDTAISEKAEVAKDVAEKAQEESPAIRVGKNGSLTVPVFVGLLRINFGRTGKGEVDQFQTLSGIASGIKYTYNGLTMDRERHEVFGVSFAFYYEPTVPVQNGGATAETLSATLIFSTISTVYAGVGLKFASSEPEFDRGWSNNWFFIFGTGTDGQNITK